jgi:23S rRNA (adenine2503-C2)-methyltransferase
MAETKTDIRSVTLDELKARMTDAGEKSFRADQIWNWLWKRGSHDFDQMTNLSLNTRNFLKEHFTLDGIKVVDEQVSSDRTVKCAFEVGVSQVIEGVLIPTRSRMTACISSQVGCSLACKFCATGKLKLLKNLSSGEIYDQVAYLNEQAQSRYQIPLSNIVLMGMGEPLLNYKNVLAGIERITAEDGLGFSPRRVTLSTAGIAKMIRKLGDDKVKFNLALSLHAANDTKRSQIMEINDSNDLKSLSEAIRYFYECTGSRVTFEYIIFKDFNDNLHDARELANFAKVVPCKINIIEYNPIDDGEFQKSDPAKVDAFASFLEDKCNLVVNVRRSRGQDIDAACGQLANKNKAVLK